MRYSRPPSQSGALLVLVLVFGAIFFLIIVSFMGFVLSQYKAQVRDVESERALAIAEAGLSYYKWYLAHNPGDIKHGTTTPGPYIVPYEDPELGRIGEASLKISGTTACGVTSSVEIRSTGATDKMPNAKRTVYAKYARPTVAEYSFILHAAVWAGGDRDIYGPYHSNGGIRMDGTNYSLVTSGATNWTCNSSFGCTPDKKVAGVFGGSANKHLWKWGVPQVDFSRLTLDLAIMKEKAKNSGGTYIPPTDKSGYHVTVRSDNTIAVREVTRADSYKGYTSEKDTWHDQNDVITTEGAPKTYIIDPTCPLIFVEDKVWLDGQVGSKIAIAAADLTEGSISPSIILNGDITYANDEAGLLAVAEQDVLLGLKVPNNMTVQGIFIAQNGRFGRNHYKYETAREWRGNWRSGYYQVDVPTEESLPAAYKEYVLRNSLSITGTVVSNGRVGTQWSNDTKPISGFLDRTASYDRRLVADPPPLTPTISSDYKFIEWRQEQ